MLELALLLNYWLPQGFLYDIFFLQVLSITSLPWDAKVFDIIYNGLWAFPSNSLELQQIWDSICIHPCPRASDHFVWKGHTSGRFSGESTWKYAMSSKRYYLYILFTIVPGLSSATLLYSLARHYKSSLYHDSLYFIGL